MTYLQCLNSLSCPLRYNNKRFQVAQGYFGHLISLFVNLKYGASKHLGGEYPTRKAVLEMSMAANGELYDLLCRNLLGKNYW